MDGATAPESLSPFFHSLTHPWMGRICSGNGGARSPPIYGGFYHGGQRRTPAAPLLSARCVLLLLWLSMPTSLQHLLPPCSSTTTRPRWLPGRPSSSPHRPIQAQSRGQGQVRRRPPRLLVGDKTPLELEPVVGCRTCTPKILHVLSAPDHGKGREWGHDRLDEEVEFWLPRSMICFILIRRHHIQFHRRHH